MSDAGVMGTVGAGGKYLAGAGDIFSTLGCPVIPANARGFRPCVDRLGPGMNGEWSHHSVPHTGV
jgi:hypothetical protein